QDPVAIELHEAIARLAPDARGEIQRLLRVCQHDRGIVGRIRAFADGGDPALLLEESLGPAILVERRHATQAHIDASLLALEVAIEGLYELLGGGPAGLLERALARSDLLAAEPAFFERDVGDDAPGVGLHHARRHPRVRRDDALVVLAEARRGFAGDDEVGQETQADLARRLLVAAQ